MIFTLLYSQGSLHQYAGSAEHNSGVFSRFRANHSRSSSFNEETLGYHTIDLRISTIKMDAEDTDLRLCFRIISPLKTYTLQVTLIGNEVFFPLFSLHFTELIKEMV